MKIASGPIRTSTLYTFDVPAFGRAFIPADHRPRRVIGFRSFNRFEIAVGGRLPGSANLSLTVVEARSMKPRVVGLVFPRMSNQQMRSGRAALGLVPANAGPIPFPLSDFPAVDVGACYVSNGLNVLQTAVIEVFYADQIEQ